MLVVSKSNRYSFVALPTIDRDTSLRTGQDVQRGIQLDFRPFGLPDWARNQAREEMGYPRGLPHDEDPGMWFGMFDTDIGAMQGHWTDEQKLAVEQRLLESPSCGVEYVIVEKPKAKPPWPSYDKIVVQGKRTIEHVVAKILENVRDDGYDPSVVRAYEEINLARPEVLTALDEFANESVPGEELVHA